MKLRKNIALAMVCLVLGTILAWQFKSIDFNKKTLGQENKRAEAYKDEILMEKHKNEELSKRNEELKRQVTELESARGNENDKITLLQKDLERARLIAGLVPVKGKGVIITVDNDEISVVEERNILDIINELRASDAQAISVNDERIVATSEIREAGRYIMINGRQMLAPFVIKAISDPDKVEHTMKMVGGVMESLSEIYQLKVSLKKADNITIPKVRDDGSVIKTDLLTIVKD